MLKFQSKIYTNKLKIWEAVVDITQLVFRDDLYDIGTEDSFFHRKIFADIDLILVLHRIDLEKISMFMGCINTTNCFPSETFKERPDFLVNAVESFTFPLRKLSTPQGFPTE